MIFWKFLKKHNVLLLLLFLGCWRYGSDFWVTKWAVLSFGVAFFIGFWVRKGLKSTPAGLWTTWTLWSGIWVFTWPDSFYQFLKPHVRENIEFATCSSTFTFVLLLLLLAGLNSKTTNKLLKAFGNLNWISASLVLLHFLRGKMTPFSTGGFFDQGSMEGCFIAITYPLSVCPPCMTLEGNSKWKWFVTFYQVLTPLIAIFLLIAKAGASQPIGVIAGIYIVHLFMRKEFSWFQKGVFAFLGLSFAAYVGTLLEPKFFFASDRIGLYKIALRFLNREWQFLLHGMGNGSYLIWGPLLQTDANYLVGNGNWMVWLHSDFLQTLFEQGIIGLILCLWTGIQAFFRKWKTEESYLALSLLGFGLTMIFNMPFHYSMHAFLGLFLLMICLRPRPIVSL